MAKLNQILAIEKGVKTRAYSTFTELHKLSQKDALLNGFSKVYEPREEAGERYAPESVPVQFNIGEAVVRAKTALTELFDVTAAKDFGNLDAIADVVVDGDVIVEKAPVTFLLFLEKQLNDINTFVSKFVVLDASLSWTFDETTGEFRSDPVATQRTRKVQKPLVLYHATDKHPAQTQVISEDVAVGDWTTVKRSGAISRTEKDAILQRISTLLKAVKFARERANAGDAPDKKVGERVFNFIFS